MVWKVRKQNKYFAKTAVYKGVSYHSIKEAAYARDLDLLKRAGKIKRWERQVKIELTAHGKHICNYYVDFLLHYPGGVKEYVEVKGFETPVFRLKWKMFEVQYGGRAKIKLTIVK